MSRRRGRVVVGGGTLCLYFLRERPKSTRLVHKDDKEREKNCRWRYSYDVGTSVREYECSQVEAPRGMADQLGERSRDYEALCAEQEVAKLASAGRWAGEDKAPAPEVLTELILQNPNAPLQPGQKKRGPTTKKELSERAKVGTTQNIFRSFHHESL